MSRPDGRKKLTIAGRVSIMLTILGLVISVVSEDLQRRQAARSQAQQVIEEAQRTNAIIIAGQPLTSLRLTWAFRGLDRDLMQKLKKGYDDAMAFIQDQPSERTDQQNSAVVREDTLYPFLVALSRRFTDDKAKSDDTNVAVLLALDDDQNSILPFGFLDSEKPWLGVTSKTLKNVSPPSVEIRTHSRFGNSDLLNWPELHAEDTTATISWHVDPSTFAKALNRQNQFIVATAKLPNVLRIAILFDIQELPFTAGNFALAADPNFWKFPDYPDTQNENFRGRVALITKDLASSVQLIPNNSSFVIYNYTLKQVYETLFIDSYGGQLESPLSSVRIQG